MAGTIELRPGQNVDLRELAGPDAQLAIGFGWRLIETNGPNAELVPLALVCGPDGKALSDDHLVFFNQLAAPDGATKYVQGADEEQIEVDLATVPAGVERIVLALYIDPDVRRAATFTAVRAAYFRVLSASGSVIARHDLPSQSGSDSTAMILGELYRHRGDWKLRAVSQGYRGGLKDLAADYGVAV